MTTAPLHLLIWVDALRFCALIAAVIKFGEVVEPIRTNIEAPGSTPRGRAIAWLFASIGVLIGAGIPFFRGIFSFGLATSDSMARIIIGCWACVFVGFAIKTADRGKRKGLILAAYAMLIPLAWFASSLKHTAP
jgi:hypothetical protein